MNLQFTFAWNGDVCWLADCGLQLNVETIIYFCSSAFYYLLAHILKAKGTGKETTLSTKIETDTFVIVKCIELQKYLRSQQYCVSVPAKNQVYTFHLSLYMIKAKGTGKETSLSISSKTPSIKLHIISAFATNFPVVKSSRSVIFFSFKFTIHKDWNGQIYSRSVYRASKVIAIPTVLCVPAKNQVLTSPLTFPVPQLK